MRARLYRAAALGVTAMLAATFLLLGAGEGESQGQGGQGQPQRKKAPAPVAKETTQGSPQEVRREQQPGARESVQADVSARTVSVTSSFNGTEIVIFGAVDNSQQPSAESGYYDVVIVVEGVPGRVVARRKNNVAGL
ncbi:MAG: TIGR02186 family protein, partial [Hyphomicrobiaceae bacterium]